MRKNKFITGALYSAVLLIFILSGCATRRGYGIARKYKDSRDTAYITLAAVGDNLIHEALINNAKGADGSFNFEEYYSEVKPVIKGADIAFINQETLIAGEEFGLSGYPRFNGPREVGDAVRKTGFDVVNQASNHSFDKGEEALLATLDYWEAHPEITVLGAHKSEEARKRATVITVKGLKIGFLAYTYGLNGLKLPKGKEYLVSLIERDVMQNEINALRPLCDYLVVSMHWGNEYEHTPSKEQNELALFLAENNVDLVIGHHPHVLQPFKVFEKKDGGDMLCVFSLGNFISAQSEAPRILGAMLYLTLKVDYEKTRGGKSKRVVKSVSAADARLLPLVTHYEDEGRDFKVYFLDSYTGALALSHSLNKGGRASFDIDYFNVLFAKIFSGAAPAGKR